jgi:DNA repair exonuclease SbcCD nuclease subunit
MPPQEQRSAITAGFSRLADQGIPVFLVPGHEETRLSILERLELPGNVYLLNAEGVNVSHLVPGLTVYGFPVGLAQDFRPLENFRRLDHPGVHLGVAHGTYVGLPGESSDRWLPITPEDIARSGLDYLALGHYHEFFSCAHGGTHAVYPGSPARLDFGQGAARSALLVSLGEGPPGVERLTIRDRQYLELRFDLGERSFPDLLAELDEKVDPEVCAMVTLVGTIGEGLEFFADRILEKYANSFFYLEVSDRTQVSLPSSGQAILDSFIRRSKEALNEPDLTPEERAVEEYAIRAGLIALKGGRL